MLSPPNAFGEIVGLTPSCAMPYSEKVLPAAKDPSDTKHGKVIDVIDAVLDHKFAVNANKVFVALFSVIDSDDTTFTLLLE